MAQKPSFLKRITSASTVAFAAAAIVGTGSSALGADLITTGTPADYAAGGNIRNAAAAAQIIPAVGDYLFLREAHDVELDSIVATTINLYGNTGKNLIVGINNATLTALVNDVSAPAVARAGAANGAVDVDAGLTAAPTATLTFAAGPFNFNFVLNDVTQLAAVDFANNSGTLTFTDASDGLNFTKTIKSTGGVNGSGVVVDVNNLIISGAFDAANKIGTFAVNTGKTATLDTDLIVDTGVTLNGVAANAGGTLIMNAGKNITTLDISGQIADTGTLTFQGASDVASQIGSVAALHAVNIGDGIVNFKGSAAGNIKATAINLTNANSVMLLSTQIQAVTGNITSNGVNGQGGIAVNGFNHTITGLIGAKDKSLATINFETDNSLTVTAPNANANTPFAVQNVTTATTNTGTLTLSGNYDIYGNIGGTANAGDNNALKLVSIVDNSAAAAATVTLKTGSSVNATALQLSSGLNNTLTLEANTAVNAAVTTADPNNGIITLTGASTISGDIGANAKAISAVNLGGNNLTFGGANIFVAAGNAITFAKNETLILADTTDAALTINANIVLADVGTNNGINGIIDGSTLGATQTLTIAGTIGDALGGTAALAKLNIGTGNLELSSGDAAINNLVMGSSSTVTLHHDNYKIITDNTSGNGTIQINPTTGAGNTNFIAGTSLGSSANPLKAVNFITATAVGNDIVLNMTKSNIYANSITTDVSGKGSFFFTGGGTNIVGGAIGTAGTGLFNNITVDADTTVTLQGASLFKGITTINKGGTLQLSGNHQTDSINTSGAGEGTLEFTNTNAINVNLQNTGAAADNSLAALKVSGGNVIILQAANGNQLAMNAPQLITFNNPNLGAASTLTLPVGMKLDGINITSNAGSANLRAVAVSGADSIIADTEVVGSNGNPVSITLNSNNNIEVQTPNFFGGIFTSADNQGTATFNVANGAGQVNGLGSATQKLETVTFSTNTINTGNTRVYDSIIEDGVTYTAGGIIDTSLQLGSTAGTGNVVFLNGADLLPTTTINALVPNKGNVTFQGSATVGNIAKLGTSVALVEFTGASGSVAGLQGDIYSKTINFNGYNLTVLDEQVVLSGASSVNGQITLGTNELVFTGGASTWGPNTSLNTTLAGGDLGNITINGGTITASGNVLTNVTINDQDSVNTPTTKYLLIGGGTNLTLPNGNSVSLDGTTFTSNQRFSDYSIIQDATSKDYFLQRTNIAGKVIAGDLASNTQYNNIPGLASNVEAILNPDNTGDAEKFLTSIGNLNSADTAQAIVALTAQDTNNLAVMQDIAAENISVLANRVHGVRYLHGPAGAPEGVLASPEGGVVGAADDAEDNVSYGGWAKAIYSDATQKSKGGVAGYSAKTTGGIFGFDTMANDNLMIGAAIGVTKTDMKYKNYRAGDKSTINGFSFSLYGAQQLVDNFFFQGATTFSTNQVKNKNKRYLANDSAQKVMETASASYDNLTYAVEGMFGYDAKVMENVLLTPMAGIRYIKSSDESYKETGTTFQDKSVTSKFSDKTDVIVGARVIGDSMNLSQFMFYPEAHAFVTHKVSGKLAKIQSSLDGQVTPFIGQPDKTDKTSYNLGLSVTTRPGPQVEYGIGYDANLASKYVAHQGTLKVRINF